MTVKYPKTMTTTETATFLAANGFRCSPKTLEVWRCQKRGPKYKKIGSRVFYELEWLKDFLIGIPVRVIDPSAPPC